MATSAEQLRQFLGEEIPPNGSDGDTLFLDEQISDLLHRTESITAAAAEGWRIKAAKLSDLVDTAEGTSKRSMSDLHKHAVAMIGVYDGGAGSVTSRSQSHRIVRS